MSDLDTHLNSIGECLAQVKALEDERRILIDEYQQRQTGYFKQPHNSSSAHESNVDLYGQSLTVHERRASGSA